jgi:hypothetical protein
VEEIAILAGGGDAEDILQGGFIRGPGWEGFDLGFGQSCAQDVRRLSYHFNGGIGQIHEFWQDLAILATSIQLGRIP